MVASVDEFAREEQTTWFLNGEVLTEFMRGAMPQIDFTHDETEQSFTHPAVTRIFAREECDDGA